MIKRFCPDCYAENDDTDVCVRCGTSLVRDDTYLAKLAWALQHPEPETAMRAAHILGRLGKDARPVLPRLEEAFSRAEDAYFRAELLRAMAVIDWEQVAPWLEAALKAPNVILRRAAEDIWRAARPGGS